MNNNSITQVHPIVKWTEKKKENIRMARRMKDAGFYERGIRMEQCATLLNMKVCPTCNKSTISSANLCRDKLCPTCGWRLSLKRFSEMCRTLSYVTDLGSYTPAFLTLTIQNCSPEDLGFTLKKMSQDWNRLLNRRLIKEDIAGWAKSLEITYNRRTDAFHPHFHILLLSESDLTAGQMNEYFKKAWRKAARLEYNPVTDYREINDYNGEKIQGTDIDNEVFTKAILETFKYSIKSEQVSQMPLSTFRAMVNAIAGCRMVSYGGIIKEARKALMIDDEDEFEEGETAKKKCECGEEMLDATLAWSFTKQRYKDIRAKIYHDYVDEETDEDEESY